MPTSAKGRAPSPNTKSGSAEASCHLSVERGDGRLVVLQLGILRFLRAGRGAEEGDGCSGREFGPTIDEGSLDGELDCRAEGDEKEKKRRQGTGGDGRGGERGRDGGLQPHACGRPVASPGHHARVVWGSAPRPGDEFEASEEAKTGAGRPLTLTSEATSVSRESYSVPHASPLRSGFFFRAS